MVSGISGQGPHTGYKSYGARHATEYAPWANENIIICPSIESLEGLENVEEIATLAVLVRSSRNSGALNVGGPPQKLCDLLHIGGEFGAEENRFAKAASSRGICWIDPAT